MSYSTPCVRYTFLCSLASSPAVRDIREFVAMLLGNTLLDVDVHTQGLAPLALPACAKMTPLKLRGATATTRKW